MFRFVLGELSHGLELIQGSFHRVLGGEPPRHQAHGVFAVEAAILHGGRNRFTFGPVQAAEMPSGVCQLGAKGFLHHSRWLNVLAPFFFDGLDLVEWRWVDGHGLRPGHREDGWLEAGLRHHLA